MPKSNTIRSTTSITRLISAVPKPTYNGVRVSWCPRRKPAPAITINNAGNPAVEMRRYVTASATTAASAPKTGKGGRQRQHHRRHHDAEHGAKPRGGDALLRCIPVPLGAQESCHGGSGGEGQKDEHRVGGQDDRVGHRQACQCLGAQRAHQSGVGEQVGGLGGQGGRSGHGQRDDLAIPTSVGAHRHSVPSGLPANHVVATSRRRKRGVRRDTNRWACDRPQAARRWPG